MLVRLFVKAPLFLFTILGLVTLVIPVGYWIITGKSYLDVWEWIDNLN